MTEIIIAAVATLLGLGGLIFGIKKNEQNKTLKQDIQAMDKHIENKEKQASTTVSEVKKMKDLIEQIAKDRENEKNNIDFN